MTNFAMPVSLYMSAPVLTVPESTPVFEVHRMLTERRISCVPVIDGGGVPVGVISRTDLLRAGRMETKARGHAPLLTLPDQTARELMHVGVFTVTPDTQVGQAANVLVKRRIHRAFVEDSGRLVGVLSTKELLLAIRDKRVGDPISEHMSPSVFTISVTAPLSLATDRLAKAHVSGLVVVDEDEWPVGTFSQTEALLARDVHTDTAVEEVMSYAMLCLDVRTPLFRAAAQAHATFARRVLAIEDRRVRGVLSGLDFARVAG
ncbi:MAG TPA: CBS domain-containing protein [Candidatus Nanopelagicales bacterium]|nr:CBS domain-containing protein [Candidatus Nanopelagicales bacterium]